MDYESLYNHKTPDYYTNTRNELLPFVPKNIKIVLDVGCGNGSFGYLLNRIFNCLVHGIEPNSTSAKEASKKLTTVYHGYFDENYINSNERKFDCIFFNDVLEHMLKPEAALDQAKHLLTKNGKIVASIPNIRFYPVILSLIRYKDFEYKDSGVLDKTHFRFFTKKSMIRLFENSGFKVEIIAGINKQKFKFLNLINFILFNQLEDMSFPQYVIVARNS